MPHGINPNRKSTTNMYDKILSALQLAERGSLADKCCKFLNTCKRKCHLI